MENGVINYGAKVNNLTIFFHVTCRETGMRIWIQLLGDRTPKILQGKNVNYSARFRTSDFDREYLRQATDNAIDKLNTALLTTIPPNTLTKNW